MSDRVIQMVCRISVIADLDNLIPDGNSLFLKGFLALLGLNRHIFFQDGVDGRVGDAIKTTVGDRLGHYDLAYVCGDWQLRGRLDDLDGHVASLVVQALTLGHSCVSVKSNVVIEALGSSTS